MSKFVITALFLISTTIAACYIVPIYQENQELRQDLDGRNEELMENRKEIDKRRNLIQDLNNKPEAINKIAREKFGFCGKGERVYKFTDEDKFRKTTN